MHTPPSYPNTLPYSPYPSPQHLPFELHSPLIVFHSPRWPLIIISNATKGRWKCSHIIDSWFCYGSPHPDDSLPAWQSGEELHETKLWIKCRRKMRRLLPSFLLLLVIAPPAPSVDHWHAFYGIHSKLLVLLLLLLLGAGWWESITLAVKQTEGIDGDTTSNV